MNDDEMRKEQMRKELLKLLPLITTASILIAVSQLSEKQRKELREFLKLAVKLANKGVIVSLKKEVEKKEVKEK